jgi:hypothetical protein
LFAHLWLVAALILVLLFRRGDAESEPEKSAVSKKIRLLVGRIGIAVMLMAPAAVAADQVLSDGWVESEPDFTILARMKGHGLRFEPTAMVRYHTEFLMHRKNRVVHDGVRSERYSFRQCMTCHMKTDAGGAVVKVGDSQHFCTSCHRQMAVTTDCFECHSSKLVLPDPVLPSRPVTSQPGTDGEGGHDHE